MSALSAEVVEEGERSMVIEEHRFALLRGRRSLESSAGSGGVVRSVAECCGEPLQVDQLREELHRRDMTDECRATDLLHRRGGLCRKIVVALENLWKKLGPQRHHQAMGQAIGFSRLPHLSSLQHEKD